MTLIIQKPTGANLVLRKELPADAEADAYIAAVEAADGQALEPGVKFAIKNFVLCCKQDGVWDAIKASCILAGARTLNGALVPLKGAAPTNNSFVSADYNRKSGLKGGGIKDINTNKSTVDSDIGQNNLHISLFGVFSVAQNAFQYIMGTISGGWTEIVIDNRTTKGTQMWISGTNYPSGMAPLAFSGFFGGNRNNASTITAQVLNTSYTRSINSVAPPSSTFTVFRSAGSRSDGTISFYSIGSSLDINKLNSRVNQLINDIQAAIP